MRTFHICGLGNAIVDIFVEIDDAEFAELGFERGGMRLVEAGDQKALLARFQGREQRLASGGSVANSIIAFTQLGGKAAFLGCVGDDPYGFFYHREFDHLNIEMGVPIIRGETTGTCAAIITPDAERTMRTCLAVSSHLAGKHIDEERIKNSEWLFVEGYVLANPETGQGAVKRALEIAKRNGVKVALTCSDAFIVHAFGDAFRETLAQTTLLFCNSSEAAAIAPGKDTADSFSQIKKLVPNAVITDGPHGAYFRYNGSEGHVPGFPCQPKDLTGAGDMFAGTFLYGVTHGYTSWQSTKAANYLSMKVILQIGARLHHDTKTEFQTALAK